jgi:anaerobic magnesium-protoporphyrin IX monomethyl ester cyclase
MNIALIYPAIEFDNIYHKFALPSGLLSLTSVIETNGYGTVDIYDSRHMAEIPGGDSLKTYDVIGFTAMSMQISHALSLAQELRTRGYDGPLIFGGPHASVAPDHLKKQEFIDAIFIGEAEETLPQYLNYLSGKPHKLQRTWIRGVDHQWVYHEGDAFIRDLDALPFPSRDKYDAVIRKCLSINITTTRGCPYKCNYCQPSKEILFGKHIRRRSVDNIITELNEYITKYSIDSFSIDDDTFTFDESVVIEFCKKVKPLNLSWSCQTRTDIKTSTLEFMKDAGCTSLFVGAESGSQRMLDVMGKRNSVENNEMFINACKQIGISVWCNMMLGYPGETIDDMSRSFKFIKRTRPERVCVSQVTPFPGTKLWMDNADDIILRDWDDVARHVRKPKFKSMEKMQAVIELYIVLMSKEFDDRMIGKYIYFDKMIAGFFLLYPNLSAFILKKARQLKEFLLSVPLGRILLRKDVNR